jgi:phenylalanyl-tRNA synthetase beta chain
MKIPLSWLRNYVEIGSNVTDLAHSLTMAGLEVGSIDHIGDKWDSDSLVVAQIIQLEPHPNADRLRLPTLDLGKGEKAKVVCGAPNLEIGQKIVFAKEGANLFNPRSGKHEILKGANIRGIESKGMVCSALELGIGEDNGGILVLDDSSVTGTPIKELLSDSILDTELTPNRPDCLSVIGTAYEIAALLGTNITIPESSYQSGDTKIDDRIKVSIQDPFNCPRYTGSLIEKVTVAPSPLWLQDILVKSGQRPINNIVDITNYVMLEYGQPLHAFDFNKLEGDEIIVRQATECESLETLDSKLRTLTPPMLVIADTSKPIALAGIMGGMNTEIDEETTDIFLEAANFDAANTRATRSALGLNTEASYRFEREIRHELAPVALKRATYLITQLCGGKPAEGIIDTFNAPHHIKTIEITETRFEKILGVSVAMKDIWNIIKRLGFEKIEEDLPQTINVTPPFWRSDISIQDDIIEEYARIYGYDNLPTSNLASPIPNQGSENPQTVREHIRDRLVSAGMNETISYSITDLETINLFDSIPSDQQAISIANPMDASKKYLRPTLLPNVLETLSRNRRIDQQNGLRLFEIGRVFLPLKTDEFDSMPVEKEEIVGAITGFSTSTNLWSESDRLMDFFDAKGIVEHIFRGLSGVLSFTKNDGTMYETGKRADIFLNEVLIGQIGELKSDLSEFYNLVISPVVIFHLSLEAIQTVAQVQFVNYSEPSRYPYSFKDLALISNKEVDSESIVSTIMENKLVADSFPIDKYVGVEVPDGKQSLTVRIIFQSNEKTLSAKEIDRAHTQIIKSLEHRYKISERYS